MKILVLAGTYPHGGHPFSGVFNEKCATALKELCEHVEVLAPRPYVPIGFTSVSRWRAYAAIKKYEVRSGIPIHRPASPIIPRIAAPLWVDLVPYLFFRSFARELHKQINFDAIVSLDLVQAGGIAWRLSKDLGIPASGWAFGNDVRYSRSAPLAKVVVRAIRNLDLVFYQSEELVDRAGDLLGVSPDNIAADQRIVLPHGIPVPPCLPQPQTGVRIRRELGIALDKTVVLSTIRIVREKGIFEFIDAVTAAAKRDPKIVGIVVGSHPAYDQTSQVVKKLEQCSELKGRFYLLSACSPEKVWEYLCAADIFAFPSHQEGMPNALLEAMAMNIPCVAFDIPPLRELEAGRGGVVLVPPLDANFFAEAIIRLADSPTERIRISTIAKIEVMDRFMLRKNMARALEHMDRVIRDRRTGKRIEAKDDFQSRDERADSSIASTTPH